MVWRHTTNSLKSYKWVEVIHVRSNSNYGFHSRIKIGSNMASNNKWFELISPQILTQQKIWKQLPTLNTEWNIAFRINSIIFQIMRSEIHFGKKENHKVSFKFRCIDSSYVRITEVNSRFSVSGNWNFG